MTDEFSNRKMLKNATELVTFAALLTSCATPVGGTTHERSARLRPLPQLRCRKDAHKQAEYCGNRDAGSSKPLVTDNDDSLRILCRPRNPPTPSRNTAVSATTAGKPYTVTLDRAKYQTPGRESRQECCKSLARSRTKVVLYLPVRRAPAGFCIQSHSRRINPSSISTPSPPPWGNSMTPSLFGRSGFLKMANRCSNEPTGGSCRSSQYGAWVSVKASASGRASIRS